MANYFLFLDELKPNDNYKFFCMGGCFIEENHYRTKVVPMMKQLKNNIFGNCSVVLHENEIRKYKDTFQRFKDDKSKEEKFWNGVGDVFKNCDIHTLCVGIDMENLPKYYPTKTEKDDEYYIALQIILENFVHFLIKNNGMGCVYFESRDMKSDYALYEHYNMIKKNGTLFLNSELMGKHLKCISFPLKIDNNIGLQLADFVPNPVVRHFQSLELKNNKIDKIDKDFCEQRDLNIFQQIQEKAYNGNIDRNDRFGLKKIL